MPSFFGRSTELQVYLQVWVMYIHPWGVRNQISGKRVVFPIDIVLSDFSSMEELSSRNARAYNRNEFIRHQDFLTVILQITRSNNTRAASGKFLALFKWIIQISGTVLLHSQGWNHHILCWAPLCSCLVPTLGAQTVYHALSWTEPELFKQLWNNLWSSVRWAIL